MNAERPITKIIPMSGPDAGASYEIVNYTARLNPGPYETYETRWTAISFGRAPTFDTREQAVAWSEGRFTQIAYLRG